MSAKKIRRFENQQPSDKVEMKTNSINILDYDSLSKIFMQLPISERMVMERVCLKWKEACELAWYDIKKFKCTRRIVQFNENRLLTQSYVKKVLKKCGFHINELSLSKVCNSNIMPYVVKHCKNLTSLEFVLTETPKFNDNDYLALKELEKLKSIKIHVNNDGPSNSSSKCMNFQSRAINHLPSTINEIHLIYGENIKYLRQVFFNLKKFTNLHSLTLRGCSLDDIIEDLSKTTTLVNIDLQGSRVFEKKNIVFDKLVNLEHVSINNSLLVDNFIQKLVNSILNTCKKLRYLEIFNTYCFSPVLIENWENLGNLVHMSIHSKVTTNLATNIVKHCYNLKYLEIRCGNLKGSSPDSALQILTELKNLECLILPAGIKLSGKTMMMIPNNWKKFKHLEIINCTIDPVSTINELSKLQHLEYLNLAGAKNILDSSIIVIAQKCKNLKYLNINSCNCISERALLTLTILEKLKTLNVGGIEDVTDKFIVRLKRFESLDFHSCKNITDNGIVQLIKNCPDLKDLNLRSCNIQFSMIVEANQYSENPINNIISYSEIIKF